MNRNGMLFGSLVGLILTLNIVVPAQTSNVRSVIDANEAKFSTFFAKGDVQSVSDLYSSTGKVLPPNGEIIEGRAKIKDFWQSVWESGVKKLETKITEIIGSGNSVSEVGTYTLYGSKNEVLDEGKYIVVWKKEGRSWMMFRDIWNSSRK
jgi:ketosteroid isomerase-like protein